MRILSLVVALVLQPLFLSAGNSADDASAPSGKYVVVALRMASDVASSPLDGSFNSILGQTVSFDEPKVWLDGQQFDETRSVLSDVAVVNILDPDLSDVMLPPLPIARVESRWLMETVQLVLNGKSLVTFLLVDRRVLVVPMANGALNAVLEKPLEPEEVRRLQVILKETGNLEGNVTGVLDQETREAIASWAEFRGAAYRFADPVISENLLAGLNVLDTDE